MISEIELKKQGKIQRLTNKTFKFDERIASGFYTAEYFLKVNKIIKQNLANQTVTMQWFQRKDNIMLCGIDEAISILHTFAKNVDKLKIYALNDGDIINSHEPVLRVSGRYEDFGFLENIIDAVLARRSSIATNAMRVVSVANKKDIFCMADRQDDIYTQIGDGYAAYVAGINKVATNAQGLWWGGMGRGTMPHALIQICGGDILKACELYIKTFPEEKITALVDYNNDVINDSLKVAREFKEKIAAVRVDTSSNLIDKYFLDKDTIGFDPHGVCKELIFALRCALDNNGFENIKIVVSSGFTPEKIADFEKFNTPVDVYGVGSFITKNDTCGFTGDLVELNGKKEAKFGRKFIDSDRLKIVNF
ncbi:nicotinate phosphoribosyltransferase [Campylobacter pinnipediorum]|uniref:nicotinate phosphoribosyltransferase n=1 Tax=Campylobacter pinnipediorum TaxID=1965231 RepID=UPI000994E503|nr:nicotinate phosphoribosyltransferase [Campylobacter pinnipediorum]AQW85767.1 nicotinate phosphoribosyltransferase, subgroup B [Campylobacter pinnipediorum subsp. caledonicus]